MKICISSAGNNLDSAVDPRFGRCPFFLIVDSETNHFEAISNPGANAGGGAGIAAAQIIVEQKVDVVITGNVGSNAFDVLQGAGIKIHTGVFNTTAKQAISTFKENKLETSSEPSGPNYMVMPNGLPPRGRALGRGGMGRSGGELGRGGLGGGRGRNI